MNNIENYIIEHIKDHFQISKQTFDTAIENIKKSGCIDTSLAIRLMANTTNNEIAYKLFNIYSNTDSQQSFINRAEKSVIKLSKPIYSVDINESEQKQAQITRDAFEKLTERLTEAFEKLKIVREMLGQFKDSSHFVHIKDLFVRYKHRITDLFNDFLNHLQISLQEMNKMLSDNEMENIKDTIVGEAREIRDGVEELSQLLDTPDAPDFINDFGNCYDRLEQRTDSLNEIITDHLFSHIDYDILGRIKLGAKNIRFTKKGTI